EAGPVVDRVAEAAVRPSCVDPEVRADQRVIRRQARRQLPLVALLIVPLAIADRRRGGRRGIPVERRNGNRLPRRVVLRPPPGMEEPEAIAEDVPAERLFPDVIERVLPLLAGRRLRGP